MIKFEKVRAALEARKDRSAWNKGVTLYAFDLLDTLEEAARGGWVAVEDLNDGQILKKTALNGADGWSDYSWGGLALIYNKDIALRLCTPSELKRTGNGSKRPNASEEWLDVQARALHQACARVRAAWIHAF